MQFPKPFHIALTALAVTCATTPKIQAQTQTPTVSVVANYYASLNPGGILIQTLAPRMLAALAGSNLGPVCGVSSSTPQTSCNGVSVLVNSKPATIYATSPTLIQFQAPPDLTGTAASIQVQVQSSGQTLLSAPRSVSVLPANPALQETGASLLAVCNQAGGSGFAISASNPAHAGDRVICSGTGFGAAPVKASLTVGGKPATINYAGIAPGAATTPFDQVDFIVPDSLPAGNAQMTLTVTGGIGNGPPTFLPIGIVPTISGISNNASGAAEVESGSWVSIYGTNLASTTRVWQASDFSGNSLPIKLDDVSVTLNGKSAAVYYISPGQVNVQAPSDSAVGPIQVQVTNKLGTATDTTTLRPYAPGFFTFQNKYVAAVHTDATYVAPAGYFGSTVASGPAQPGEVLLLYGTGFGPTAPDVSAGKLVSGAAPITDPSQLRITIGGVPATVQFAGIVAAGEYQFNVVVPQVPDGDQPIMATIAGASTQAGLSISIKTDGNAIGIL